MTAYVSRFRSISLSGGPFKVGPLTTLIKLLTRVARLESPLGHGSPPHVRGGLGLSSIGQTRRKTMWFGSIPPWGLQIDAHKAFAHGG